LLSILVVSTAALLVVVLRPERANSLKAWLGDGSLQEKFLGKWNSSLK
jgi:hypothetical protein